MIFPRRLLRNPSHLVVLASAALAIAATLGEVSLTGSANADIPILIVVATFVVWCAAWAPWWLPAGMALTGCIAATRHGELVPVVLTLLAGGIAPLHFRLQHPVAQQWLPRIAVALNLAAFARLRGGPFVGAPAVFAAVVFVPYVVVVVRHMGRRARRRVWWVLGGLVTFVLVASVGFATAAWASKDDLSSAEGEARAAITAMRAGDFATGAEQLHAAEARFRTAKAQLHQPWVYLATLVPGVAQNRAAITRLVDTGTAAIAAAADAADQIDPSQLAVRNGGIDLAAVEALQEPIDELQRSFLLLADRLNQPVSIWVPGKVEQRITSMRNEAERYRGSLDRLVQAIHAAPDLLGASGPRRYFLAFSSPAESRSLGGYVGNWGILRADQGRLTLEQFGRSSDLVEAVPPNGLAVALPPDFTDRYGGFHFVDSNTGRVTATAWKNITITPDLPTMATVTMRMWQATFHQPIDGVMVLDPYALAQLLRYAGPQHIPGYAPAITADNAADFIMRQQYLAFPSVDSSNRVDALDVLAHQTVDALLRSELPGPIQLLRDLGPLVQQRRLALWTAAPAEQQMLDAVGLSDRFPPATGAADFGITFNNAAPNKIDAYLAHTVSTRSRHDNELGVDVVDVTLRLTNTAPTTDLPYYVGGNTTGDPANAAVLYLSMYGSQPAVSATLDGADWPLSTSRELGLNVASNYLVVPAGTSATVTVTFIAPAPTPAGGWRVSMPPTAQQGTAP